MKGGHDQSNVSDDQRVFHIVHRSPEESMNADSGVTEHVVSSIKYLQNLLEVDKMMLKLDNRTATYTARKGEIQINFNVRTYFLRNT